MILLDLCSGICWACVYLIAIIHGFREKTWCIPQISICLNFAWEFWVVRFRLENGSVANIAFWIQFVWLILDVGVLVTWLCFAPREAKERVKQITMLMTAMFIFGYGVYREELWEVSSFMINLIMSVMFVYRLKKREKEWVNSFIAPLKLFGTLAATILNGMLMKNSILLWIGGLCFMIDCYYWLQITRKCEKYGNNKAKKL